MIKRKIINKLRRAQDIYIFTHTSPDGDCISCALIIALVCKRSGKNVKIFTDDIDITSNIRERISKLLQKPEDILGISISSSFSDSCKKGDLFVMVDCGEFERIGYFYYDIIANVDKDILCENLIVIDHHIQSKSITKYSYIDSKSISASELCYCVAKKAFSKNIDLDVEKITFFGIGSDSGFFRFLKNGRISAKTLRLVSKFTKNGVSPALVSSQLFSKKDSVFNIYLSHLLENVEYTEKNEDGYRVAIVKDDKDCFDKYSKQNRPVGTLFDILFSTKDVGVIVFLKYSNDSDKIDGSVRVSADCNFKANEFSSIFSGGGHEKASGFHLSCCMQEALEKIKGELLNEKG